LYRACDQDYYEQAIADTFAQELSDFVSGGLFEGIADNLFLG